MLQKDIETRTVASMSPRPQKYDLGPTIAVENDGLVAAWTDGHFRGDKEIIKEARFNIELGYEYRLFSAWVKCGEDTPLGVAAALCSYRPGRALLVRATEDVFATLMPEGCIREDGDAADVLERR